MAYTSDKKPGGLTQVTSLSDNDNVVVDQSGSVKRATLDQLETKIFDAKTGVSPVTGTEVVVVRKTDNTLGQVALSNVVPDGNITNTKIAAINSPSYLGITDNKLATIDTAGKVTNQAVQAVSTNTANRIVARDGSGNFSAGTITASLSGNASTATTASTATALATGRTIAMTGDVTYTSPAFNGTSNVTAAATLANSGVSAGTYNDVASQVRPFTVDAKGRVTSVDAAVPILISQTAVESSFKKEVKAATTAALTAGYVNGSSGVGATLTNAASPLSALSLDGVTLSTNDRVLVKNQAVASHNGIYTVTNAGSASVAWILTRATDVDSPGQLSGAVVTVESGAIHGGKLFTTNFKSVWAVGVNDSDWYQVVTTGDGSSVSNSMLQNNSVTNDKLRDSSALSVIGRSANSSGDPSDIAAGTDGHVLRRSGTALGFGQVATAGITDAAVTTVKIADANVTEAKLANNAVTTAKIADADVTFAKLSLGSNFPIQVVQAVKTDVQTLNSNTWVDITGLSLTLTRRIASSSGAVRIQTAISCSDNHGGTGVMLRIVRGSTVIGIGDAAGSRQRVTGTSGYPGAHNVSVVSLDFIDNSPGSTATVTYRLQAKEYSVSNGYINRSNSDIDNSDYGQRSISTMTLTELTP